MNTTRTLLLTLLFICFACCLSAAERDVALRLGVTVAQGAAHPEMGEMFAGEASATAGNGVVIEMVPFDGPGADAAVWQGLVSGSLDMGLLDARQLATNFPGLRILAEPFLFAEPGAAHAFYLGDGGSRIGEILRNEGIDILGWVLTDPFQFRSAFPMTSADAFSGKRIGVHDENTQLVAALRVLGAVPVPLSGAEPAAVAAAGQMDAVEGDPAALNGDGYPEDWKHLTISNHFFPVWAVCLARSGKGRLPAAALPAFERRVGDGVSAAVGYVAGVNSAASGALMTGGVESSFLPRREIMDLLAPSMMQQQRSADSVLRDILLQLNRPELGGEEAF